MPQKLPFMKFYPADWMSEPELRQLSLAAKGLWIELLCLMWKNVPRGSFTGNPDLIARAVGSNRVSVESALNELLVSKVCDVTKCNDVVTLSSRRMVREERQRNQGRKRQRNKRERDLSQEGNDSVTPQRSDVRGHISDVRGQNKKYIYSEHFEKFWKRYPDKTGKGAAYEAWKKMKGDNISDKIMAGLEIWEHSQKWVGGFIALPTTWLNQRRWEDDPPQAERSSIR